MRSLMKRMPEPRPRNSSGAYRWEVGIDFLQSGNFYRGNQMYAGTPFQLDGTTQVDWGGNVGF